MGERAHGISDELAEWLTAQPVFFVATAPNATTGHVNCSPKGNRGEFGVLGPTTVAYVDQTGSGVETIAHVRENGRITLMFCAFEGAPRIVRLQGRGVHHGRGTPEFDDAAKRLAVTAGARAIIVCELDRVADSCGFGVPILRFAAHRPTLDAWADKLGPTGLASYRDRHNRQSLDGLPGLGEPGHANEPGTSDGPGAGTL